MMRMLLRTAAPCLCLLMSYALADERALPLLPESDSVVDSYPHHVSVSVGYGWLQGKHNEYSCSLSTLQADYACYLSSHHALTISFSGSGGGKDHDTYIQSPEGSYAFSDNYDRFACDLMVGYRFSQPIGSRALLSLGAMVGPDLQRLRVDYGRDWSHDHHDDYYDSSTGTYSRRKHGKNHFDLGLAYSLYASANILITRRAALNLCYAYRGATAHPVAELGKAADVPRQHTNGLHWHEVRAGVSFFF